MITNRELEILKLLVSNRIIKSDDLSTRLDVSSRTILRDIATISYYFKDKGIKIESSNEGYEIVFENKESRLYLIEFLRNYDALEIYKKIFIEILENENIKIYELSEILFESETSILNRIKQLNNMLSDYNLEIISNRGFSIKGDEVNIRRFIIDNYMIIDNNIFYGTQLKNIFEEEVKEIKKIIKEELLLINKILTDGDFSNLISLIIVSIYRNGKYTFESIESRNDTIAKIISKVNKKLDKNLGKCEIEYISKNSIFGNYFQDKSFYISVENVITNSIDRIKNESINDYTFDKNFYNSFKKHIELLIKRSLNNNSIKNPLLKDLKREYLVEFSDANIIKQEIEKEFNISITEDEIGYLSIHLGATKQKSNINNKVIIICNYGIGTSQVVKLKIQNQYKNLDVIGLYPVSYLEMAIAQNPDYIVSTVKINQDTNGIPIVDASKILYSDERLIFNDKESGYLKNILFENLFFDLQVDNKKQFFEKASELIKSKINIDDEILKSVIMHEDKVSTEIGNLVAIPHAIAKGIFNSFVAIFRLDSQILWKEEKVKFIFLIVINEKDKKYIESLNKLYEYILDASNISKMNNAKDFNEFVKEII